MPQIRKHVDKGSRFARLPSDYAFPDFAEGEVWIVGAGPGDPGLLSLYALHALRGADVVLHDSLVAPSVLALADEAELEYAGKRAGGEGHRQEDITARLIELARSGKRVLRLKGGDPGIFGRGGEEAEALARAGCLFAFFRE